MADKTTKEPFPRSYDIANRVHTRGLQGGISLYPGTGTKDGVLGDHVLLAPAYTSTLDEIKEIALKVRETVYRAFEGLSPGQTL